MLAKKFILFLFCLLIPVLAYSEAIPQKEAKVLVVYYSRTGNTRMVAEKLAQKFNADLEQLIDRHKRTGLFGFTSAGKDALAKKITVIAPLKYNPGDYDIILIGGPSWISHVTPAIRTFILQNDLSAKAVGLFGTCHVSGVEQALAEAKDLISKGRSEKFPILPLREKELTEEILTKKIGEFYQAVQEVK